MDRRDDERVPDELKEAAEWMREARTEPTPLQLDELKQRAHRQAARRGGSGARWRIRAVTTLLVGGLMMTSATGVVLATGGGSSSILNSPVRALPALEQAGQGPVPLAVLSAEAALRLLHDHHERRPPQRRRR